MSNIAGKAYAMNVVTPIYRSKAIINRLIFWFAIFTASLHTKFPRLFGDRFIGLNTLSLIHYARWAIVDPDQFPRLDESQPKETLQYTYMFFFSNFNGSWDQYVDSFHMAIPTGLDGFWYKNIKYPNSVPLQPFHHYITFNQVWTNHYYNAYPLAASNDVKGAKKIKAELLKFIDHSETLHPDAFKDAFDDLLLTLQHDLGLLEPTPIVSLASVAVAKTRDDEAAQQTLQQSSPSEIDDLIWRPTATEEPVT